MILNRYQTKASSDYLRYTFVSEGPQGQILKVVQFDLLTASGLYNLSFGDADPLTGLVSDQRISNNGDTQQVLATVAGIALGFLTRYPDSQLIARGSTPSRTRLYQMGINQFFDEINARLIIIGFTDQGWEPFERNRNYEAFLAQTR